MKATLRARLEALERKRAGTVAPPDFMYWEDADGAGGYVLNVKTGEELTGADARRWIDENGVEPEGYQ